MITGTPADRARFAQLVEALRRCSDDQLQLIASAIHAIDVERAVDREHARRAESQREILDFFGFSLEDAAR